MIFHHVCVSIWFYFFFYNETEQELKYIRNPRLIKLQTGSHVVFLVALAPRRPCKHVCESVGMSMTMPRCPKVGQILPHTPEATAFVCAACCRFSLSSWRSLETATTAVKTALSP